MPIRPNQALLRALDTAAAQIRGAAANPPLVERGEGPSPELTRASQVGFGQAVAARPAVVEAQAIMNENMRTLIEVDEADRAALSPAAAWPAQEGRSPATIPYRSQEQRQRDLREALRANHPQVRVDVNPIGGYVTFSYRGENISVSYPVGTVPDTTALRARAIDYLPRTGPTATEVRIQQEAAISRSANIGRMWMDEAAAITADAWQRMETGHARAGTTTSTLGTSTGTLRLEDIRRAAALLDAAPQISGTRVSLNRAYVGRNADVDSGAIGPTYNPPTDPEEVAKALGVVEDQTLAALRKLKDLGYNWDGKDWVYRHKPT